MHSGAAFFPIPVGDSEGGIRWRECEDTSPYGIRLCLAKNCSGSCLLVCSLSNMDGGISFTMESGITNPNKCEMSLRNFIESHRTLRFQV